jgi:hypothetical protein
VLALHFDDVPLFSRGRVQITVVNFVHGQCFGGAATAAQHITITVVVLPVLVHQHGIPYPRVKLFFLAIRLFKYGQVCEHHNGTRDPK